jgi:tripartite ATP-independent transporter DctM subunit
VTGTTFLGIFAASLLAGVPVAFCLGIASATWLVHSEGWPALFIVISRTFSGMDSFPLLAVPLFIIAGDLMLASGFTQRLVRLASALIGHISGGLGHVNIVTNAGMAGISGSSIADASTIGATMIPAMKEAGYPPAYSVALTAAAAVLGSVIPPSIAMIIYAYVMNVSVGALFMAGIVPGLLLMAALMATAYIISRRNGYTERARRASLMEILVALKQAVPALMLPVIILGGIMSGVFTPTEAGAVAALYAFIFLLIYRGPRTLRQMPRILINAAVLSSVVYWLLATSNILGWVLAAENVPGQVLALVNEFGASPLMFLLVVNLLLLVVGMFTEPPTAIVLLAPILHPVAVSLGVDPLHFALIFVLNCVIGLATPPVGSTLFIAASIGRQPILAVSKAIMPFLTAEIVILFMVTYLPILAIGLPRYLGY